MKILVVSNFFPPHFIGGAEIIAYQQAKALAERGHEVRVFAGDNSRRLPGYPLSEDVHDGLPVTRVALQPSDFAPTGNNVAHPEVDAHFARLIDAWRPDVIHAHHLIGLSLGILRVARQRGIRIVMTLHDHWGFCINSTRITTAGALCDDTTQCHRCHASIDVDGQQWPQRVRQDYIRWQLQAVDAFVSPSRYLADAYVATGLPAERMHVIANGIDLARFAEQAPPPPGERLQVLFIGYMGAHKGVPVLLQALARLPGERLHVDLVGDGHACAEYQQTLQRIAPRLSFRFWGRLPNERIAERLAQAQVFVLPSVCPENQPVTITEAMAGGLPVVASRIGGMPELVDDGHTGLLATPGDAEDLARCLRHYLDHPEAVALHGQAGRQRIRAYAFAEQVARLEGLLQAPGAETAPASPLVACLGLPHPATFVALQAELAPAPPGLPRPGPQPGWVPVQWLAPGQADLLWVAGATERGRALACVDAWRVCGRPILVDERCRLLLDRLHAGILPACGVGQLALSHRVLLWHPSRALVTAQEREGARVDG